MKNVPLHADSQGVQIRLNCLADILLVLIVVPFVYMATMTQNKVVFATESVRHPPSLSGLCYADA